MLWSEGDRGQALEVKLWDWRGQGYSYQEQPSRLPATMRPDMRQRFLEGSLHLFGRRLRGNLRGVAQDFRHPAGADVQGRAPRFEQGSAQQACERHEPALQARPHLAQTGRSSGSYVLTSD